MAVAGARRPAADGTSVVRSDPARAVPGERTGHQAGRAPPGLAAPARRDRVDVYPQPRGVPVLVDNPVDWGLRRPVVSGIRTTVTRVLRPARGTGRPGREPDKSRKAEARPAVRQTTTPGAAPDGPERHDQQEGCLDRPRNRSRRALRPFHRCWANSTTPSSRAARPRAGPDPRGPPDHRRPRPAAARLECGDQSDVDSRPRVDREFAMWSTAWRPSHFSWRGGSAVED